MTESPIEKHLVKLVKKAGGLCYKWVSPGNVGVPDRIVFFNGGIFLVETKSTTGKLRVMQTKQKEWLAERGAEVVVLNSKEKVESWVDMQTRVLSRLTIHNSITKLTTDAFENWHKNWIT